MPSDSVSPFTYTPLLRTNPNNISCFVPPDLASAAYPPSAFTFSPQGVHSAHPPHVARPSTASAVINPHPIQPRLPFPPEDAPPTLAPHGVPQEMVCAFRADPLGVVPFQSNGSVKMFEHRMVVSGGILKDVGEAIVALDKSIGDDAQDTSSATDTETKEAKAGRPSRLHKRKHSNVQADLDENARPNEVKIERTRQKTRPRKKPKRIFGSCNGNKRGAPVDTGGFQSQFRVKLPGAPLAIHQELQQANREIPPSQEYTFEGPLPAPIPTPPSIVPTLHASAVQEHSFTPNWPRQDANVLHQQPQPQSTPPWTSTMPTDPIRPPSFELQLQLRAPMMPPGMNDYMQLQMRHGPPAVVIPRDFQQPHPHPVHIGGHAQFFDHNPELQPQQGQHHMDGAYIQQPWLHPHQQRFPTIPRHEVHVNTYPYMSQGSGLQPIIPPTDISQQYLLPRPLQSTETLPSNSSCINQPFSSNENVIQTPTARDYSNVALPLSPETAENGWTVVFDTLRHANGSDRLPARRGLAALRHAGVLPDGTPVNAAGANLEGDKRSGWRRTESARLHHCPYCRRSFRLPNGLAIHLKWHWKGNSRGCE